MGLALENPLQLQSEEFQFFKDKIFNLAGISLSPAKLDLVQGRLRSRVQNHGFSSFGEYITHLKELNDNDPEWEYFINSLTTNKTDWFREPEHFEYLIEEFIPQWMKLGKKHLKVWCAASSTGEEPYTLALVLTHALKDTGKTFEILASDIDTNVLDVAQKGVYRREQLFQIPQEFQKTTIAVGTGEISDWFKIKAHIKEKVKFKQINLTKIEFNQTPDFDLVFCRNVLIYFNHKTVEAVTESIFKHSASDSCLIIAHSESLQSAQKSPWKYKQPSIYGKGKFA